MLGHKQGIGEGEHGLFERYGLGHDLYPVQHLLAAVRHARGGGARLVARDIVFHALYFALLAFVTLRVLLGVRFVLLHEFVVIAPIFFYAAVFYVDYYFAHLVQKFAVVRHEQKGALVAVQILGKPGYLFQIEEVGRLVQKHYVGFVQQKFCKHYLGALSAAQFAYKRVVA